MSDFSSDELRVLKALAAGILNAQGAGVAAVADIADLVGQYGDPVVKFSPKRWSGTDYKGSSMSACTAEFLDVYAEALQYSSEHPREGKEKYAAYDARDASRARGWAKRIRSGWRLSGAAPAPSAGGSSSDSGDAAWTGDEDIPFATCAAPSTRPPRWERW